MTAGTANLTDMLADAGGDPSAIGGDAGASPLFKWTSDGSMMEELMRAYKYAHFETLLMSIQPNM